MPSIGIHVLPPGIVMVTVTDGRPSDGFAPVATGEKRALYFSVKRLVSSGYIGLLLIVGWREVTLQDLGSIAEIVAAVATVATLAYLAVQVRQNTRALRSDTFQRISMDMSLAADAIASSSDLAAIIVKASKGLSGLTPEERVRFHFYLVMAFRRLEAIYVQRLFGSIDPARTLGFERSVMSILLTGGASEWWESTKNAFSAEFAAYVDAQLTSNIHASIHPGFGRV